MMETKKSVIQKNLFYSLAVFVLYIMQTTPGFLSISGVKPAPLYAAAIAIALFEEPFEGSVYGLTIGLLCDTSGFAFFGFNAFFLGLCCFLAGMLVARIFRPTLATYLLYVLTATFFLLNLLFVFEYGIWRLEDLRLVYYNKVLYQTVYTLVISPIIFAVFKLIKEKFSSDV